MKKHCPESEEPDSAVVTRKGNNNGTNIFSQKRKSVKEEHRWAFRF